MPYKDINKRREKNKKWLLENHDKRLKRMDNERRARGIPIRICYKTQEERIAAQKRNSRKHYYSHLIQERERTKKWRKANPEKQRFMEKRRKAREKGAIGSHTLNEWKGLKKMYGYMCPFCQRKELEIKLTQDHIIPLSKGGSDYIDNIQPLCMSCNASKQNRYTDRIETYLFKFSEEACIMIQPKK